MNMKPKRHPSFVDISIYRIVGAISVVMAIVTACHKEEFEDLQPEPPKTLMTKSISPEIFDWEVVDYMPTPAGQTPISVPWIGSGSIAGSHALDVINDYRKADGWKLLYSTFTEDSPGPLIDPYFVLYNVYRGTLRIYLYVTTQFSQTSSYLRDALSINCSAGINSNMFDFAQGGIIDPNATITCVNQIQPKPLNGGAPFASNKWYMIEYEIAYDSNISNLTYQNAILAWQLDFCTISEITLDGNAQSSINSVISNTSNNNPFNSIVSTNLSPAIKGAVAIGSMGLLENQKQSQKYMGLDTTTFNWIYKGIKSVVNAIPSGFPGFAASVLNAVIGGTSSSSTPVVNLKAETEIKLKGTSQTYGSFPSMPISWYIPGTNISTTAQGYIPLENNTLGVIGWKGDNHNTVNIDTDVYYLPDDIMNTGRVYEHRNSIARLARTDYSSCIEFNPAVLALANITIQSHDVVAYAGDNAIYSFPMQETTYDSPWESEDVLYPYYNKILARFIFKVEPKNGAPATYIYKTFELDYDVDHDIVYH